VQEHAPGAGQILGHDRIEKAAGDPTLHDDPAESTRRGERGVVVQRIPIAGDLREQVDVALEDRATAPRRVAGPHRSHRGWGVDHAGSADTVRALRAMSPESLVMPRTVGVRHFRRPSPNWART